MFFNQRYQYLLFDTCLCRFAYQNTTAYTYNSNSIPWLADSFNNSNVISVSVGGSNDNQFICAVYYNFTVGCVGAHYGLNSSTSTKTNIINWPFGETQAKTIFADPISALACIISFQDHLICSGESSMYGYISENSNYNQGYNKNVTIPIPGEGVHQISMSGSKLCAVNNRGELYCWGSSYSNHYDCPVTNDCDVMHLVSILPEDYSVTSVAVNRESTCAIVTNGSVFCWGEVYSNAINGGFLGTHPLFSKYQLTQIELGNEDVLSIDSGHTYDDDHNTGYHDSFCVILSNGSTFVGEDFSLVN